MYKIDYNAFLALLEREETKLTVLPENTLDWHLQEARIDLLKEVSKNIEEVVETSAPVAKKAKAPVAPTPEPVAVPEPIVVDMTDVVLKDSEPKSE